jgi:fucose permease
MKNKYLLLGIAYFAFIMLGMNASILNIAWEYMRETFNLELGSLGIILAAGTIGYMTGAFINGRLLAELGSVGKLLVVGALLTLTGLAGYTFAPSWLVLLLVAFIASMGGGIIDAGLNTFLSANYGVVAMNWLHACFGIGATIAPLLVTFTVETLDQSWRTSYATLLGLQIIVIILLLLTLSQWSIRKQQSPDGAVQESPTDNPAGIRETLAAPLVLLGMLLFILYGGVEIGTGQLANSLMTEGRGISETTASYWVSIYWGTFTIGRILSGFVAMRISVRSLIRVSMIGIIVGSLLFWLNIDGKTGFIGLAVLGFMQAPLFATITSDTPRRVGSRYAPNAIGFQLAMAGVGGTLISGIAAWSADIFNNLEVIGFAIAFVSIALYVLYEWSVRRETQLGRPLPEDPRRKPKRKLAEV